MKGDDAYLLLVETQVQANALWQAAKEAKMEPHSVEIIRNFVGGLGTIQANWETERARWQEAV
jgi:hypothetical protein